MKKLLFGLAIVLVCLTLFISKSYSVTNQELQKQINDLREALNNHIANCDNNNAQFKKDIESALSMLEKAMKQVDTSATNIQLVQRTVDSQGKVIYTVQKKQSEQNVNIKNIQTQYVNLESKVDSSNRVILAKGSESKNSPMDIVRTVDSQGKVIYTVQKKQSEQDVKGNGHRGIVSGSNNAIIAKPLSHEAKTGLSQMSRQRKDPSWEDDSPSFFTKIDWSFLRRR